MMVSAPSSRPSVLLVEDNPGDVRLAREALRESATSVQLEVARDGQLALAMLRDTDEGLRLRPDLVLLDLNLPGIDGRDVLRELRADPRLRLLPVVVLTSSESPEDVMRCYELHANCYITKPPDLDELARVMDALTTFWFSVVQLPAQPENEA